MHHFIALSYSHHKRATQLLISLIAALWLLALLRRRRRDPPSPTPLSALPLAFALLSQSTVTGPGSHRTILICVYTFVFAHTCSMGNSWQTLVKLDPIIQPKIDPREY